MGFSRASRLRLFEVVNSVNRSKVVATWFAALTVPADENSWDRIEGWRRAYAERFQDRWGRENVCVIWKKEPHPGMGPNHGKPHLHLLIYWLRAAAVPRMVEFRQWNDNAWADAVKSRNPRHRLSACRVEEVKSWQGVSWYVGKYFAKEVNATDGITAGTGRIWGYINRDRVPIEIVHRVCSAKVGKRFRRILRKLQERKRQHWLAQIGRQGEWFRVRPGRFCEDEIEYAEARQKGGTGRTLEEDLQVIRDLGGRVKLSRPKAVRTKEIQVWGQEEGTGKLMPLNTETVSYCSSVHFVDSALALRLLDYLEDLEEEEDEGEEKLL